MSVKTSDLQLTNIKRTRFAASWNTARYYEQRMLKEAVARSTPVLHLERPASSIREKSINEEYGGTFDINFDDDQPIHAWIRELTEKESVALEPFLELIKPPQIGPFSKPLSPFRQVDPFSGSSFLSLFSETS